MVGINKADGRFEPTLAVDERAARAFELSRRELAEQYRDQLRGALKQYRSSHSLDAWLQGGAMALAVLLLYVLWWNLQAELNQRLQRLVDRRFGQVGLRLGGSQVLDPEQVRGSLQLLRRLVN